MNCSYLVYLVYSKHFYDWSYFKIVPIRKLTMRHGTMGFRKRDILLCGGSEMGHTLMPTEREGKVNLAK